MNKKPVTVFGTRWCGDCHVARRVLDAPGGSYNWIDIESDAEAREIVLRLNGGRQSVLTIVFPDGSLLVEPSGRELVARLEALQQ